jgi:hypothetical protein
MPGSRIYTVPAIRRAPPHPQAVMPGRHARPTSRGLYVIYAQAVQNVCPVESTAPYEVDDELEAMEQKERGEREEKEAEIIRRLQELGKQDAEKKTEQRVPDDFDWKKGTKRLSQMSAAHSRQVYIEWVEATAKYNPENLVSQPRTTLGTSSLPKAPPVSQPKVLPICPRLFKRALG